MGVVVKHVTFDCAEPGRLARFWADVVGGEIENDWGGFVTVRAEGAGVSYLAFGQVSEGKSAKNRVHIDLRADDREAEVNRVVELGAKVIDQQSMGGLEWTVLQDPEGNEFCIANG